MMKLTLRKKFTLTLLIWAAGTALAFQTTATLGAYSAFAAMLLAGFAAADLVDKKIANK